MTVTRIAIQGMVQGVGFRPFIHGLARRHRLTGFVRNTRSGVQIEITGPEDAVSSFLGAIRAEKPPLAAIHRLEVQEIPAATSDDQDFRIHESSPTGSAATALPPPDADLCPDCRQELEDPTDRRYRYPFISCTNCGPRYSLTAKLPFDRPQTSMQEFPLCLACRAEYENPEDRRFHAQTTACPACGPSLRLVDRQGREIPGEPLDLAAALLREGRILALKGLGGFQLAVDAGNEEAVLELRRRKSRPAKPLAVMTADLETARRVARIDSAGAAWLTGRSKPILLLPKRRPFPLAAAVAPGQKLVGIMLPYTPLHQLLLTGADFPALIMTSGNRAGEPLARTNEEALATLGGLADFFLLHDRTILTRIDDSVLRLQGGEPRLLRRARSFAPLPVFLAAAQGRTLALGGAEKNTFCLTRDNLAFLSQHVGDLGVQATRDHFEELILHLQELLQLTPDLLVHDLHPDYPTTRYALAQRQIPTVAVQHHHAHAVSCMAEHGLTGPVLAITLDGSGYGPDATIWGGEILLVTAARYERLAHLTPVPLPGGEIAVRQPWRLAASHLYQAYGRNFEALDLACLRRHGSELPLLMQMMEKSINTPLTSSCGRLFDGVAALLNLGDESTYDGQAAMALEGLAREEAAVPYPLPIGDNAGRPQRLATEPLIRAIVQDLQAGVPVEEIAGRFHASLAALFAGGCRRFGSATGVRQVVLTGGVLQNVLLEKLLTRELESHGFQVFAHCRVPANDGGLSLGQAVAGRAIHNLHTGRDK